jgi:GNAT superfamily N-acetyltransferase
MSTAIATLSIRRLTKLDDAAISRLAAVLVDCVEGGASVSFMAPLTQARAEAFWRGQVDDVAAGARIVFVAEDAQGIAGTVQLVMAQPENQPHRADIAKMLVHSRARKKGAGASLMRAAEDAARAAGKTVLVLDTASAEAERIYLKLGWIFAGKIPKYALLPGGGLCSTRLYYRLLSTTKN